MLSPNHIDENNWCNKEFRHFYTQAHLETSMACLVSSLVECHTQEANSASRNKKGITVISKPVIFQCPCLLSTYQSIKETGEILLLSEGKLIIQTINVKHVCSFKNEPQIFLSDLPGVKSSGGLLFSPDRDDVEPVCKL